MHLVYLGVARNLLNLIVDKGLLNVSTFSSFITEMKVPLWFRRRPRSLNELCLWKSQEHKLFLLYFSPFCFYNAQEFCIDEPFCFFTKLKEFCIDPCECRYISKIRVGINVFHPNAYGRKFKCASYYAYLYTEKEFVIIKYIFLHNEIKCLCRVYQIVKPLSHSICNDIPHDFVYHLQKMSHHFFNV